MGRFLFGVCGVVKGGRGFSFAVAVSSFACLDSSFIPAVSAFRQIISSLGHPLGTNDEIAVVNTETGAMNDETFPVNDEIRTPDKTLTPQTMPTPLYTIRSTCIIEIRDSFCL